MKATSPPARAAATDWFDPLPPGPSLKPLDSRVSPIIGSRAARKARSATNTPWMAIFGEVMATGSLFRCDHTHLQQEAAIEAPLPGPHHRIGVLRRLIE